MSAAYLAERSMRTADGCVVWMLRLEPLGYARAKVAGRRPLAHRLAYEVFIGDLKDGWDVHHLCGNRACINPEHLIQLSHAAHSALRRVYRKTHCKHGHPFDDGNTRVYRGKRQCRACDRGRQALRIRGAKPQKGNR